MLHGRHDRKSKSQRQCCGGDPMRSGPVRQSVWGNQRV